MSQYLSWIEGSPPKRNAVGSNPIWDAKKHRKQKLPVLFLIQNLLNIHAKPMNFLPTSFREATPEITFWPTVAYKCQQITENQRLLTTAL